MITHFARSPNRVLLQVLMAVAGTLGSLELQARATDHPAPVTISALHGDVAISSRGAPLKASVGMVVNLPAAVRTGADGSIELRQGTTIVSAAPNAQLDIPVSSDPAETLDRIIQSRGNVYYSIAKRTSSKLHVETRYLVAVIKGTQFNVSVTETTSTLSLLEGLVELRSANGSDVMDIATGQIGTISADQQRIRVLSLTSGETIRAGVSPSVSGRANSGTATLIASGAPSGGAGVSASSSAAGGVIASNLGSLNAGGAANDTVGALQSLTARTTGNSSANSNAGGNGNGNAGANSNAGGNGNGNAGANSNAGGNGNNGSVTDVVQNLQTLVNNAKGNGKGP